MRTLLPIFFIISYITVAQPNVGITVAGGNGRGSATNQFYSPKDIFVDAFGTMYIADFYNSRVQKWLQGASSGITLAGGNGVGANQNQISRPSGLFVDATGNIYISDIFNDRVQKWTVGSTSGITVAGGNGQGNAANQLNDPEGIFVNSNGDIFIADKGNHRVQKWINNANTGTTVAGGNGSGNGSNQLNSPTDVLLDKNYNILIADCFNHRVQKWEIGAITGTTIAGGNGYGTLSNQLQYPTDIFLDENENLFICENLHKVKKWQKNSASGTVLAGTGNFGTTNITLQYPDGVYIRNNYIYVADFDNYRVQKFLDFTAPSVDITTGLVAHYKMDGNAQDASGKGNHGIQQGGVNFTTATDRFGNAGKAAGFDGSNDYIYVPSSPSLESPTDGLTISTWIKVENMNQGAYYLAKTNSGTFDYRCGFHNQGMYFGKNGSDLSITTSTIQSSSWNMVSYVFNGQTVKFYIDGVLKGFGNFSGNISTSSLPLEIGRDAHGPIEWLNGSIDDLRIYNRALTDAEVSALYASENSSIVLSSALRFGGGQTILNVGTNYNVTATIKNNGSSSWVGDIYIKVKGGTPALISTNNIISAGGTYNISSTFTPQTAQIGTGVTMELLTKQGTNDFVRVATVNGTVNPVVVNIEAEGVEPDKIPFINVNKSQYNLGETIQVSGRNFIAGQTVTLSSIPTLSGITYPTLTVIADGSISGNLTIPNTGLSDSYLTVIVRDLKGYNPKKLVSLSLPDQREPLKAIEPNTQMNFNGGIYVGAGREFLPVKWIDPLKAGSQFQFSAGGALRRVRYKIEFEANVTNTLTLLHTFDTYTTLDFIETYNYDIPRSALTSLVNPTTQEAQGRIKITNLDEPSRTAKSDLITIYLGSIDPNLKVELLWDKSNPETNLPPIRGLVADGVSRIFVKVSKINPLTSPSIQSVQLDIIDVDNSSTDPKWLGKLMYATNQSTPFYSTEANTANAISSTNNTTNSNNSYQFWYVSPDDFMIDGKPYQNTNYRTVKLRVRVLLQGATQPVEMNLPITIVRPPLMFVHGLNGSGLGTWSDFSLQYELPFIGFNNKVDVLGDGSYDDNAKILVNRQDAIQNDMKNSFQGTLKLMHEKGYAANQVDYICHSMGGDMIRYAVENYPNDFYQNNKYKSYDAGFANKVITINTPHQGSPLADLINGFVDKIPLKYKAAIAADYHAAKFFNLKDQFHRTIHSMIRVEEGAATTLQGSDAVVDLQAISGNGGKKFSTPFTLPAHIIAGDIVQGDQGIPDFSQTVLNVDRWSSHFQALYKIVEYIREIEYNTPNFELPAYMVDFVENYKELYPEDFNGLVEERDEPLDQIEFAIKVMQNFWLWSTNTDFITEGDLIVGLKSQLSGLPRNASNVSVLNNSLIDFGKFHTSITGDNQAISKVRELLNKPVYNPSLGTNQLFNTLPATSVPQIGSLTVSTTEKSKPIKKTNSLNTKNVVYISKRDTTIMKIVAPIRNSEYSAGSSLYIKIQIPDSTNLKRVRVSFQSSIKSDTLKKKSFKFSLGINENLVGKETIFATATFFRNDTAYYLEDTLSIKIIHDGFANEFSVMPENKNVSVGATIQPTYEVRFPNYLSYQLDKSKLTVSTSNGSIVTYNNQTGNLTTLNKGEAIVIFTYDGIFKDTMYVAVGGGGLPYPQTITTSSLLSSTVCTGQMIQVPFTTAGGSFEVDNLFFVQISDKNGENFKTIASGGASPISIKIPNDLQAGVGYKIRVVSTNVPVVGSNSPTILTITAFGTPPTISANKSTFWNGDNVTLTASACPSGQSLKWSDGFTSNPITITPTESVTYTAVCTNGTCETANSTPVYISKNFCPVDYTRNTNVNSGDGTFKASNSIQANNKISGIGTKETLESKSIILNPGFEASNGVIFKVQVGGCQ